MPLKFISTLLGTRIPQRISTSEIATGEGEPPPNTGFAKSIHFDKAPSKAGDQLRYISTKHLRKRVSIARRKQGGQLDLEPDRAYWAQ
jgi:hypothetical protein